MISLLHHIDFNSLTLDLSKNLQYINLSVLKLVFHFFSLLRNILHVNDHEKWDHHLFGKVVIPVRVSTCITINRWICQIVEIQIERSSLIGAYLLQEVPAQGCDWWWDISSPSSKGSKLPCGKCRIKLHLSHQQVFTIDSSC